MTKYYFTRKPFLRSHEKSTFLRSRIVTDICDCANWFKGGCGDDSLISYHLIRVRLQSYTSICRAVRCWFLRRPRPRLTMPAAVTLLSDHLQYVLVDRRRGRKRAVDRAAWRCRRGLAVDVVLSRRSTLTITGISRGRSCAVWTHRCSSPPVTVQVLSWQAPRRANWVTWPQLQCHHPMFFCTAITHVTISAWTRRQH